MKQLALTQKIPEHYRGDPPFMTILEYHRRKEEFLRMGKKEMDFLSDICRSVGHEVFKDANAFADVCTRCGHMKSWIIRI